MNKQLYIKKQEYCLMKTGGGITSFLVCLQVWYAEQTGKMNMAVGSRHTRSLQLCRSQMKQ